MTERTSLAETAEPLIVNAVRKLWLDNAALVDEALATEAKVRVTVNVKIKYDDIGNPQLTVELAHTKRHVAQIISRIPDSRQLGVSIREEDVPTNLTPEAEQLV